MGGNGLGLYIVDTLSKALELSYKFEPMENQSGMCFTLFFCLEMPLPNGRGFHFLSLFHTGSI